MDSRIYNELKYKSSNQVLQHPIKCEVKDGCEYSYEYDFGNGITGIINKIIKKSLYRKTTNRLEIRKLAGDKAVLDLSKDADIAIFEQVAKKHDEGIQRSKKKLESVIYYIVEHYSDSVFDICDVESKVMNWFWEGDQQEHIKGGRSVQDLRNVRLRNMLTRRLFITIREYKDSEIDTKNCWYDNARENIGGKQFCRFCKQWTNQYENFCPGCRNWSSNFEESKN